MAARVPLMENYEIVTTVERVDEYFSTIPKNDLTVFDTETTGLTIAARLLGMSFWDFKRDPIFIPIKGIFSEGIPIEELRKVLNKYLPTLKVVAQNAKFDLWVFKNNGFEDPIVAADTAIMIHTYNPDLLKKLETRVKQDLKVEKATYEEIIGKKWHRIDWVKDLKPSFDKKSGEMKPPIITLEGLAKYACEDVYYTGKLFEYYDPLMDEGKLRIIHDKIELPNIYLLRDMKVRGVEIDVDILAKMETDILIDIHKLEQEIYEEAGCEFNINSSQQKGDVLYNKLGLPILDYTATGNPATDKHVLEELSHEFSICKKLIEYSAYNKLYTGYIKAIPEMIDEDGRLRCDFNSDGTRTGRLSSNSPNLQNQPNNEKYPVRKAFVPKKGYKFLVLDWSQIELRVMAHASKDERMTDAFNKDEDIHGRVADDLNIPRKGAKVINFGVLYGMGPDKLAQTLGISSKEAEIIVQNYHSTYEGFAAWKKHTEHKAARDGYITNLFGRIRRLPNASSGRGKEYYQALRQSVNTVIQGSAADMMKLGIIKIMETYKERNLDAHLLLVVHDEYIIEVREDQAEEAFRITTEVMESVVKLRVPIKADGIIANNWAEMKMEKPEPLKNVGLSIMDVLLMKLI